MIYEDVKMDKKKEKKNIKDFIPAVLVSLAASFYAYGICTNRDILFQSGSVLV